MADRGRAYRERLKERLTTNKALATEGDQRAVINCGGAGGTMGPCAGDGKSGSVHDEAAQHLHATGGLSPSPKQISKRLEKGETIHVATQDKKRLLKSLSEDPKWSMTGKKSGEVAKHESGQSLHIQTAPQGYGGISHAVRVK